MTALASTLQFDNVTYKSDLDIQTIFDQTTLSKAHNFSYGYTAGTKQGKASLSPVETSLDAASFVMAVTLDYQSGDEANALIFSLSNQSLPTGSAVALSSGKNGPVSIPKTTVAAPGLIASTARPASSFTSALTLSLSFWLEDTSMLTGASLTLDVKAQMSDESLVPLGKMIWMLAQE